MILGTFIALRKHCGSLAAIMTKTRRAGMYGNAAVRPRLCYTGNKSGREVREHFSDPDRNDLIGGRIG